MLLLPVVFALGALLLAVGLLLVEPESGPVADLFPGDAESARAILSTIAGSTITLAGLVFSITMLVLQLSSSQYSPTVLRTFLTDVNSHLTLATFVATFTYSIVVLRAIGPGGEQRPTLSVTVAQLLMLVTIGVLVQYVNHITRKIRVNSIMHAAASDADEVIGRLPTGGEPVEGSGLPWTGGRVIRARGWGYVSFVDREGLLQLATDHDARIRLLVPTGEFVTEGEDLFRAWDLDEEADTDLLDHVVLAEERTSEQDPSFVVRQLVDIALRALSPSLNDPTTASQALFHLRQVLHTLREHGLPRPLHRDADGAERLVLAVRPWSDYTKLATEEIGLVVADQPQVRAALRHLEASVGEREGSAPVTTPSPPVDVSPAPRTNSRSRTDGNEPFGAHVGRPARW
jgi:uncharacterized membrane protein